MAQQIAFKGGSKEGRARRAQQEARRRKLRRLLVYFVLPVVLVALLTGLRYRPKAPVSIDPTPTPEAALRAFWSALGSREHDKCLLLWPELARTYGGERQGRDKLRAILGEDRVSGIRFGRITLEAGGRRARLPYVAKLRSGRKLTGTATLRFEEESRRWVLTGGI